MNARRLTGAALAVAVLALAACSSSASDSNSSSGAGTSQSAGSGASSSAVAAAKAAVQAATTFPTSIPVTDPLPSAPPKGKTVLFLQCEEQTCGLEGDGMKAAAAAIGWNVKVLNFQAANPATLVTALKTGLQYKPVAAFFSGAPQEAWQSVQQDYAKAGAFITENNDSVAPSGDGVEAGRGYAETETAIGKVLADEQIADSNGAPVKSLLVSVPSYSLFIPLAHAYKDEISKACSGCEVTEVDATLPQMVGGQLIPAVVSAAKRISGLKYIVSVNAAFVAQLPQALMAAGLGGKFKIIAGQGIAANQKNVLDGSELAMTGEPFIMDGWEDVDMAIRYVMHLPIPAGDHKDSRVLLTKDNIGTPRDSYDIPADYAEQFKKLWRVG